MWTHCSLKLSTEMDIDLHFETHIKKVKCYKILFNLINWITIALLIALFLSNSVHTYDAYVYIQVFCIY